MSGNLREIVNVCITHCEEDYEKTSEKERAIVSQHIAIHALRISVSEFTFVFVTAIVSHVRPIIGAFLSAVTRHSVGTRPILLKCRNKGKRDSCTHEHTHTIERKNRELHVERPQRPTVDKWLKLFLSADRGTRDTLFLRRPAHSNGSIDTSDVSLFTQMGLAVRESGINCFCGGRFCCERN